jgi:ariadne-1
MTCRLRLLADKFHTRTNVPVKSGPTTERQTTVGIGGILSTAATVTLPVSNVSSLQGTSALRPSSSSLLVSQETDIANDSVQERHSPTRNLAQAQHPVRPGGHGGFLSNPYPSFFGEATSTAGPLQLYMPNMVVSGGTTSTPSLAFSLSALGQPITSTALGGSFGSNTRTAWGNSDMAAASSSQPDRMGMDQQAGTGSAMNLTIGLHPNAQQPPPKYVKIWEVTLRILSCTHCHWGSQQLMLAVYLCYRVTYTGKGKGSLCLLVNSK